LTFDINQDSQIVAMVDLYFSTISTTLNPCLSYYLDNQGSSTGCYSPSGYLVVRGFGTSLNSGTPHRIWELQIPRSLILATATNSPLRFALRLVSSDPVFDVLTPPYPPYFWTDFSGAFLTDVTDLPVSVPEIMGIPQGDP
jgi:hypothetical protein